MDKSPLVELNGDELGIPGLHLILSLIKKAVAALKREMFRQISGQVVYGDDDEETEELNLIVRLHTTSSSFDA